MKMLKMSPSLAHMGVSEIWSLGVPTEVVFLLGNMMRHHGIFWGTIFSDKLIYVYYIYYIYIYG